MSDFFGTLSNQDGAKRPNAGNQKGAGQSKPADGSKSSAGRPAEGRPADDGQWKPKLRVVSETQVAETILSCRKLTKGYRKDKHLIPVLRGVDLTIRAGEFVSIIGQSGSGKSTLLHLLGVLDAPDHGQIEFEGNRIDHLPAASRDLLRNRHFGMVFQFYHLLPELSTLENVLMPTMIAEGLFSYWRNRRQHIDRATELLKMVGLQHRLTHRPRELSGGEMQRTAVARALMPDPQILFADEPTGNLDCQNGQEILALLRSLNKERGLTIVMVTHDGAIAQQADRTVRLVEGVVHSSTRN